MNKFSNWLYRKRARYYGNKILPFIKANESVLDVGAGSGYVGELISKKANVTLIDIVDYNQTKLPLIIYDGKKLPFEDDYFDSAIIIGVLHHAFNPEKTLEEVKRVCNRIIIIEETYKSIFGKILLNAWDGFWSKTTNINTFYNFHSKKEWGNIFDNLKLKLISNDEFKNQSKTLKMTSSWD